MLLNRGLQKVYRNHQLSEHCVADSRMAGAWTCKVGVETNSAFLRTRGITGMAVQDFPKITIIGNLQHLVTFGHSLSARLHGTRHQELLPRKGREATNGRAHRLV